MVNYARMYERTHARTHAYTFAKLNYLETNIRIKLKYKLCPISGTACHTCTLRRVEHNYYKICYVISNCIDVWSTERIVCALSLVWS